MTKSFLIFLIIAYCIDISAIVKLSVSEPVEKFADGAKSLFKRYKYDPRANLNPAELIAYDGYPVEVHNVTTSDGYILTIYRIPQNNGDQKSQAVILQHGLGGTAADFICPVRGKALAYMLYDQGYDIWLPSQRGTTWSQGHVTLSSKDSEYWDFSWGEMGEYDMPAIVSHVANAKKDKVMYIGHSEGTTVLYVMAITRPDISNLITRAIHLAPVGYLNHPKAPFTYLNPLASLLEKLRRLTGKNRLRTHRIMSRFLQYGCEKIIIGEQLCDYLYFSFFGADVSQFNKTLFPVIQNHRPNAISTRTVLHYGQLIRSGNFQKYDYGKKENLKLYNQSTPPLYDLNKVNVPLALIYADNDWLAGPEDTKRTYAELPMKLGLFKVNYTKFNHLDFIWGIDAPELVFKKVMELLQQS